MPVHVLRRKPRVLQPLPEKPRLPYAANLVTSRDEALDAILKHQLLQLGDQVRPHLVQFFVIRAELPANLLDAGKRLRRRGIPVLLDALPRGFLLGRCDRAGH